MATELESTPAPQPALPRDPRLLLSNTPLPRQACDLLNPAQGRFWPFTASHQTEERGPAQAQRGQPKSRQGTPGPSLVFCNSAWRDLDRRHPFGFRRGSCVMTSGRRQRPSSSPQASASISRRQILCGRQFRFPAPQGAQFSALERLTRFPAGRSRISGSACNG